MAKSSFAAKKNAAKGSQKVSTAAPTERAPKRARIATPPPTKSILKSKAHPAKPTAGPSKSKVALPAPTPAPVKKEKAKEKGKGKEQTKPSTAAPVASPEDLPTPLPTTFKVVAGSYEKLLYGLTGSTSITEGGKLEYHLKPLFIFPAHVSCIKAVAASPQGGKWLATGSADEIIKIWDLRRKKEVGGLMHHEGSITHLSFPSRSYLLSASEDGSLCLFRARDWAVLRALKGHKGRVNAVAVHPSGKLALTVGKDRTLRMWDLMRGKGCASTKIGKEGETAQWSSDGSIFAVQSASSIDLYNTNIELLHIINHSSRIHDIQFTKNLNGNGELLFVAAEDKKVSIYAIPEDKEKEPSLLASLVGHENRVKQLRFLEIALPTESGRESTKVASTVSSDGFIHVYDLSEVPERVEGELKEISPVAKYNTNGTRLTCLTLADGDSEAMLNAGEKRKRAEEEAEESDEDEDEDDDHFGEGSDDELEADSDDVGDEEIEVEGEEEDGFGSGWEDEED